MKSIYVKRYILLLFSQCLNFGTALFNSILLTTMLSKEDYGMYKYGQSFLNMIAVFAQLGIPFSASRLLIRCETEAQEQKVIGITERLMLGISICFSLISYLGVICIQGMGGSVNSAIHYGIPAIFLIVLQQANLAMLQGTGKARGISVQTFMPPMIILVSLLISWSCFHGKIVFRHAWFIFCSAYLATHILTLFITKASLTSRCNEVFRDIKIELKKSGKNIYIGSLIGVASSYCIELILGYISGMEEYAVYSLALSLATALQTVPSAMGTVMFKRNANEERIAAKNIAITFFISGIAYVCFVVAIYTVSPVIFGDSYAGMKQMASILGIATVFYGLGDFFNRFISANGFGTYIQVGALLTGISNIAFSFILIRNWEVQGIITAKLVSGIIYLATMIYFYIKTVKGKRSKNIIAEAGKEVLK